VGHNIHRYEGFQGVPDRPTGKGLLEARQSAGKRIRSGDEKQTVVEYAEEETSSAFRLYFVVGGNEYDERRERRVGSATRILYTNSAQLHPNTAYKKSSLYRTENTLCITEINPSPCDMTNISVRADS
jgi:hypothetical protein